jgi:hypothetical protein
VRPIIAARHAPQQQQSLVITNNLVQHSLVLCKGAAAAVAAAVIANLNAVQEHAVQLDHGVTSNAVLARTHV